VSSRNSSVLVDVTQYANWAATTGIQRVLLHLACDWPPHGIEARFGVLHRGRYATGPLDALATFVEGNFTRSASDVGGAPQTLLDATDESFPPDEIASRYDAFLLPEPTLQRTTLDVVASLSHSSGTTLFFIYYDALPLTHPHLYPFGADHDGIVTRYHTAVAQSDHVAFISETTRRVFEARLGRGDVSGGIVARPGADGLTAAQPQRPRRPTFTIVGTIEPRKRHRLVLEAFEQLWRAGHDYKLVVVGSAGWEQPELLARLRTLAATGQVEWIEESTDDDVARVLARSSAVVFTPEFEGYGLPPLESLACGLPVVVGSDLPSLEGLEPLGQIRLDVLTAETLASAVRELAHPVTNRRHRSAIAELELPTWKQFTERVADWIGASVDSPAARRLGPKP
jgi:glycosyltransferase involved in cell wall biosynthesis